MKWTIYAGAVAAAIAMPIFAEAGRQGYLAQNNSRSQAPQPFDADLYRKDEQVFSFHGDFLFWRIQEGALDYALSMTQTGWGPTQCFAQGDYKNATFNGDPGFRIALSYFRAPKYWEFWGQYTRLTSTGENHASKPSPSSEFLTGTWPQIFTNPMASASSFLHVNYNLADVFFTRVFFPNPHLRLRVLGGGTVAWMSQFWKILYADSGSFHTKIANRWSYTAGGLRLGTLFDWYWFTNIYMTGGATFATLLGSYHNSSKQTTNFQPSGAFNTSLPLRDTSFKDVRPSYQCQFFLGPSYQQGFTNSRFEIFVGYELSVWQNLQEIFRSTHSTPSDAKETWINTSMIAFQGLTARATVDF